ncbi:MAG: hypothetical protein HY001_02810 [Candidatus Portnoybacteria bacterium]|nr:hypothetical protein [Candidatus Portnoybacteria bacterium]
MSKYILGVKGLSNDLHDNSIAILKDGKILFAASEERYSRIKHDGSFPSLSLSAALNYLKLPFSKIDTVAIGFPAIKVLTLGINRYVFDFIPFFLHLLCSKNVPIIIKDIALLLRRLTAQKKEEGKNLFDMRNKRIVYVDHHLAHAASAYYTSGYKKCLVLSLDGFGTNPSGYLRSGAVFLAKKGELQEIMSIPVWASLGLFYQAVTLALGFTPRDGEGKTMGLAAYGDYRTTYAALRPYAPHFERGEWQKGKDWPSGFFSVKKDYANLFFATKFGKMLKGSLNAGKQKDIAAGSQYILEEEIGNFFSYLEERYPYIKNIALAGGLFLNVKVNKKIAELPYIKNVFVHPNAGDGGTALGAAFVAYQEKSSKKAVFSHFRTAALGEEYSDKKILQAFNEFSDSIVYERKKNIPQYTADEITKEKVVGWFQGRAEWGPRALGQRSVLADPRSISIKERINKVLKNREWFMPFAPSVLEEKASDYFMHCRRSPFMTFTFDVVKGKEKEIKGAIHVDNTARPNTVSRRDNPLYYQVIEAFYKKTGVPAILNTSFNRHGLPIVNSPHDALEHLLWGAVDELIIGNYAARKK